jgi:cyclopropane fatty-acyl-phospholipid synthase-like methyltransferase
MVTGNSTGSSSLEEIVVTAMDGSDVELFPFLPYILQDVWELASSPKAIIYLVRKHTNDQSTFAVLDLGCGKGAVSINLAGEFKCTCFGIDAVEAFIEEANRRADEFGVRQLCRFEVGDIRLVSASWGQFEVIILGSIGPVFGDYYATLTAISQCLAPNGIIILDDGYIDDNSEFTHPLIEKRSVLLQQIEQCNMEIIDEKVIEADDMKEFDNDIFENLKKRCEELIEKHPEKRTLFENYIRKQEEENEILETKVVCSTMVIKVRS